MPVTHQVDYTLCQQDRDLPLTHGMLSLIRFSLGGIADVDAGAALEGMVDVRYRQHIVWSDLFPVTWSHKAQRQNTTIDEIFRVDVGKALGNHGSDAQIAWRQGGMLRTASSLRRATKPPRSEERRVGKECRSRWSPYH